MAESTVAIPIQVGSLRQIPSQCCLLSKRLRNGVGVAVGGTVRILSQVRDTVVTRRVYKAPRFEDKDQYVFLSPEDLFLLHVNINDVVILSTDVDGIECP